MKQKQISNSEFPPGSEMPVPNGRAGISEIEGSGFRDRFIQLTHQPYRWAKLHAVSHGTVTSILENRRPQLKTIRRIVELTGCSEAWLVHGEGEMYPEGRQYKPAETTGQQSAVSEPSPASESPETGVQPTAINHQMLAAVMRGVDTFLQEGGLEMPLDKKAELVAVIYELYHNGHELTPDMFNNLIRLAA